MKSFFFYKPFLYLLLFLFAEKVLLIPAVRERFTVASGVDFDVHAIEGEEELSRKDQKQIWVFGTSRSVPFGRTPSVRDIQETPGLNQEQREQLERHRIYSFSLSASIPVVFLHHYLYLREKGYRPDLVWIEVSSFAFNENYSLRRSYIGEVSPDAFIMRHLDRYPPRFLKEWLTARLFVGSIFPPTVQDDSTRFMNKAFNPLAVTRTSMYRPVARTLRLEKDRSAEEFPDLSSDSNYRALLQRVYGEWLFSDYTADAMALDSLDYLIAELEKDGIPFVLWTPPVHQNFTRIEQESGVERPFTSIVNRLRKGDRRYVRISTDSMQCRLFTDESHLADVCYTELAAILIDSSK
ncbi:DUF1574 family protein [Leptonema illini]|nr:DUF1574 family protein [Leptonema illini]